MLELKFYKELPIRSLNQNHSFAEVKGADLYIDKEGNRFAFISFKNSYKTPLFSLYLHIKEYDSSGTFLKEDRFSIPNIYGTTGMHVINEPIPLENSCDGIEVYVYFAEYNKYNFYNDKFVKHGLEIAEPTSLVNAKTTAKMPGTSAAGIVTPTKERKINENGEYDEDEFVEDADYMIKRANSTVRSKKPIFNFIPILIGVAALIIVTFLVFSIQPTLTQIIQNWMYRYGIY
jgi:hypothetical protein